ncbi:MAG: hypothetical protein JJU12_02060 [Chlamydiales bacterium]|nr:hypothetical protein [Chlamydiales bacterium]
MEDLLGNQITTTDPKVIESVDHFIVELLKLGKETSEIAENDKLFSDVLLVRLYRAALFLFAQTKQGQRQAKVHLDAAEGFEGNAREESLFQILKYWYGYRLSEALKAGEAHMLNWPRDLGTLKIIEYLYYCKGQEFEGSRFLKTTQSCFEQLGDNPYFLSIHSFAQELTGRYLEAKATAERAIDLEGDNPWAHHTLTHVYIKRGEVDEGIDVLEPYSRSWNKFSHMIASHNYWHLALLYLENLDYEGVIDVIHRAEWETDAELVTEEIDAAALYWRLDMDEVDLEGRWEKLAQKVNGEANCGTIPFVSAQLLYALKRGGEDAALNEALETLEEFAGCQSGEERAVWEVGLPLVYGALAFAERDFKRACRHLDPVIKRVACVGGSDAQVDLFRQAYFFSLKGARRYSDARAYLEGLTSGKVLSKREEKCLSQLTANE